MNILAFDTCLDKMYAVLQQDEKIIKSEIIENHDNKYHSAFLISALRDIMYDSNIRPQDIDLIAVNIGPGSFTGIRACVTVARVMAQQLNCKTAGISSLEILSKAANIPNVALDARKNSAYFYTNNEIKGAVPIEEIKKILNGENLLTDDRLQPILGGTSYQQIRLPIGETLAKLAREKITDGDWQKLKPLYIQPPPAM